MQFTLKKIHFFFDYSHFDFEIALGQLPSTLF